MHGTSVISEASREAETREAALTDQAESNVPEGVVSAANAEGARSAHSTVEERNEDSALAEATQLPDDESTDEPSAASEASVNPPMLPLAAQNVTLEQRVGYVIAVVVLGGAIAASATILFAIPSLWRFAVIPGWIALAGLMVFSSHFWPQIKHRHYRWRSSDAGMEIHRGVLWKHRIAVPILRVQHVDVSQGPVQRLFKLGSLTIHTAGTKNASVMIEGLEYDTALQLRDELLAQKETLDAGK
ncbi:MAG: PH domain-containing protein [Planctomycetota bacterium]